GSRLISHMRPTTPPARSGPGSGYGSPGIGPAITSPPSLHQKAIRRPGHRELAHAGCAQKLQFGSAHCSRVHSISVARGEDPPGIAKVRHRRAQMTRIGNLYGPDATFLGVPAADLSDPPSWAGTDIMIIGAPFDGGTSHRPGARFGPQAIRFT